ncbi:hypothetical protein E2C01_058743 [Portunus trituberculatus]|uniref:Uncharacterized protein n=1 Tax=Portunus trituberculatus TaxID=210409 RepID=A0A5B7H506_PORTR|nr:hypothetical protein [Portunus trituberculatus]
MYPFSACVAGSKSNNPQYLVIRKIPAVWCRSRETITRDWTPGRIDKPSRKPDEQDSEAQEPTALE